MPNPTPAKIDDAQARAALPDDVEALKAMVLEQRFALATRDTEIEQLKLLIAKLKRMQFGRSSERIEQLELLISNLEEEAAAQQARRDAAGDRRRRGPASAPPAVDSRCRRTCRASGSYTNLPVPAPRAAAPR